LLAVNQGLFVVVVVDASAEETVERQLVISLPAVGVDDRVQPGFALGGYTLANGTKILGRSGRGYFKPKQRS
jgi:hypothetical protein